MRIFTIILTAAALAIQAADAAAQQAPPPAAAATGTNSNSNTLSTGNNANTNANSNSQFLSGNNTGVNNGALEVYAGSEPYQGIVLEGSTNLPQLPGVLPAPSNFSQPYKPDTFINTPVFFPAEMTLAEAKECRDAKANWYGGTGDDETRSIKLFYAKKPQTGPGGVRMANYVGTAMATTSDGPFIAALCEAAYRAMRKGATVGMVEFSIRPKNTMVGIGFGTSGGATGLPAAGAHPYAIAGTLGFGTGWSNQKVEGEVVLQLTALRGTVSPSAADTGASSASTAPVPDGPGDGSPAPPSETPADEPHAAAAPSALLTAAHTTNRAASAPRAPVPSPSAKRPLNVAYHAATTLATVQRGQSRDRVFGLFGAAFVERDGKIVEVRGMRLRASGRSKRNTRIDISEVRLANDGERETLYWFLFEDDRLITWGRSEQWPAAARSHRVDVAYTPEPGPLPVRAKVKLVSGR
jgi:hypothetical protein